MTTPIFETHTREHNILEHIREGMKVFDAENQELGKVDFVYLGEVSSQAVESGNVPQKPSHPQDSAEDLLHFAQKAFGKDKLEPELRQRLLYYGYAHVDVPGLLTHNRYVLPDQITRVTDDGIYLLATRRELVKEE